MAATGTSSYQRRKPFQIKAAAVMNGTLHQQKFGSSAAIQVL